MNYVYVDDVGENQSMFWEFHKSGGLVTFDPARNATVAVSYPVNGVARIATAICGPNEPKFDNLTGQIVAINRIGAGMLVPCASLEEQVDWLHLILQQFEIVAD